jgi:hypothetical protein
VPVSEESSAHRFKPGQSGNPKGRPPGSRNKTLVALEQLGADEVEGIVRALIEKAKSGDAMAARPILDRVWPARKGARYQFDLPEVMKAEELPQAIAAINRQTAEGDISPDEASLIVGLVEAQRRAIETSDLAVRLAALEERLGSK